jgi:nucleoside-diphosphate-sugar epimerase
MRVFLAGAAGAVGRRLIPALVQAGHSVFGLTRSEKKADAIRANGAQPVIGDALDRDAVMKAVQQATPHAIIHQLTAISQKMDMRHFDREFALTNRLRSEGTDYLIAAGLKVGVRRFVAQSYAGWPYQRTGGPVKTEDDPLDPNPPKPFRRSLEAIQHLESTVLGTPAMEGLVLRYGGFYGPGNAVGEGGMVLEMLRKRMFPVIDGGTAVWSFIHIDDVAKATLAALERGAPGVYNITDDEPARVSQWLPELALATGAKPPFHIPAWLGRLLIGEAGIVMMMHARGASNAKAKRELSWNLIWPTWREGFRRGLNDGLLESRPRQTI